jgi:hypothetical protein
MFMQCKVEPLRGKLRCHLVGHRWYAKAGSVGNPHAVTTYEECIHCKARRVTQEGSVYQPVDWEWLNWHSRKVRD